MIKDGRDGDCVLSDPYEVVLPVQACDKQRDDPSMNVNQQFPTDFQRHVITKRSLSIEEEECLEKPLTIYSITRISPQIKYWENVAKGLALTDVKIIHLGSEHKSEPVDEQTYQMLYSWIRTSERTSFRMLVDVLKKCEENGAVNFILDNLLTPSSNH